MDDRYKIPCSNFCTGVSLAVSFLLRLRTIVYICEIFYLLNIALIKASILSFYLRVFPTRSLRMQCWIGRAFCLASGIVFAFTIILQCNPIPYAWNRDLKGRSINSNAATWVSAAINILLNIHCRSFLFAASGCSM
jgi:hypothetical protein